MDATAATVEVGIIVTQLSVYDYLSFILPGGLLIGATALAFAGEVPPEPSATGLVLLTGAAFFVGHAVAALASAFERVLWLRAGLGRVEPEWSLFGKRRPYSDDDKGVITNELENHFGRKASFGELYRLAYTALQAAGKDQRLQLLNREIGFYRNSTVALVLAGAAHLGLSLATDSRISPWWSAVYLAGAALFRMRYLRFYTTFGDNVIRGIRIAIVERHIREDAGPRD